jgi:hypothetical protein
MHELTGTGLVQLVVAIAVLLIAWYVNERFSPDPLITKIVQIAIYVIALLLIIIKLLPLVGL